MLTPFPLPTSVKAHSYAYPHRHRPARPVQPHHDVCVVLAHQTRRRAAAVVADYPDQLGHCPVGILPRRPRQPFRRTMGHQALPAQNHAESGNALRIRPVCRAVFKRKNHTELFTELCLRFGCRVFRV